MRSHFRKYLLNFKQPAGTSRGVLNQKETFFLIIEKDGKQGMGECAVFRGLSVDDVPNYEQKLAWVCENIQLRKTELLKELIHYPSILFGVEQAFLSLESGNPFVLFPSLFTEGKQSIPINGLIWMGKPDFMKKQISQKLDAGFTTLKLKIGAIDFETELALLKYIRSEFRSDSITIRVDANGAFSPNEALERLKRLADFDIHSIEQPIKAGQWEIMAELCSKTPVDIALDEELIGIFDKKTKSDLLSKIKPQYIILKPSLHGGIQGTNEWISLAENDAIGWWITSALESNIGLNAIAQYTYSLQVHTPQGLGTGSLFANNIISPLEVNNGALRYNNELNWKLDNVLI